jgi:hypothetical protein
MKKFVFFLFMLAFTQAIVAQSISKSDVTQVQLRNAGAIIQNGEVKGYYQFYNLEKQDRKNSNYLLNILDENLKEISAVTIVRPNSYLLVESAFNGDAFGFLFYDYKEKSLELIAYDRNLKETGKVTKELKNKFTAAAYAYIAQGNPASQAFLAAVPGRGFVYYGIKEDSKSDYEIEFYNNSMKKIWASYGPDDDYDFENSAEAFQSEQYVGSLILKRKGLMSTDIEFDLLVQTTGDGKSLFKIPLQTSKYKVSLTQGSFDAEKQQFVIFGEYYNKEDNAMKSESLGFINLTLDLKGKVVSEKVNPWTTINKLVPAQHKEGFDKTSVMFHSFVKTSDGQTYAIGEQYRKGGTPMAAKVNVFNMVIFQFDADFIIKKIHIFEKDKNSLSLPQGMLLFSPKLLSYVAKSLGGFDYYFTQVAPDNSTFVVTYVNYDKEKGERSKNVLGSIILTPEKEFTVDKFPLNRESTSFRVFRGKPGYVMVSEYFEKEKRLETRLEKLNY